MVILKRAANLNVSKLQINCKEGELLHHYRRNARNYSQDRSFDRFLLVYIILDGERYGYKKTFPGALQVFSI